jgi:hypothetical protein
MSDAPVTNPPSFYLDFLQKVINHLVGITVLCYLSGFVITNLYLGSLGIVNLDLLRARYVLSGLLFLFFIGTVIYLIYGLNQNMQRNRHQQPLKILLEFGRYSLISTGLLYIFVLAMSRLAGSPFILPVGIPTLTPALPWSAWFAAAPIYVLRQSASIGIGLLVALIIVLIWIAIDPKDMHGVRTTRRQALVEPFRHPRRLIGRFFFLFVFMLVLVITASLLDFIRFNNVTDLSSRGTQPILPSGGWLQFFLAIVIIYIVVATVLIFRFYLPLWSTGRLEDKGGNVGLNPWIIYFTAIAIAVIPQLYAIGVYPSIPQQLGGGQVLPVSVTTSRDELKFDLADPNNDVYMIDRASSSTLFFLVGKNQQQHRVIEISNSLIQSITYLSTP